ncbi:MAG: alanine racemase [Candidatus Muiribacteriota bacterium]
MSITKALINLSNLEFNLKNIKSKTGKKILLAVKANAYGHGAVRVSQFVQKNNLVDYVGVATLEEALELKKNNITLPVLKFSQPLEEELNYIVDNNIETALYSPEILQKMNSLAIKKNKSVQIHVKIDTGMGRVGLQPDELGDFLTLLSTMTMINLKGVMTHLASSDSDNHEFTLKQLELFRLSLELIRQSGFNPELIHAANSGGILQFEESYFDMVRPGIMAYGYYPSPEVKKSIEIKPVMTLVSKISYIKKVHTNTPISYGGTYRTFEPSYIATIPAGYGDGYSRSLTNRGKVMISGLEFKIAGRVCMDQFMIDIGKNEAGVKVGDEVVLFGSKGQNSVSLDYLCSVIGTIPYEPLCNIAPRVERYYSESEN